MRHWLGLCLWAFPAFGADMRPMLDITSDLMKCVANANQYQLVRIADNHVLDTHTSQNDCEEVRLAAHGGVVCAWFTPSRKVGPGGWNETGWRPTNVETDTGLGRKTF